MTLKTPARFVFGSVWFAVYPAGGGPISTHP
jgi:hypothetical protein